MKPTIVIEYCPKCGWLLRAAYMAQELLTTFSDDLFGVTLAPSALAGTYKIYLENKVLFDRKSEQRFPDVKELKQIVRGIVAPDKDLGHTDKK